jgi:hypothetical protein
MTDRIMSARPDYQDILIHTRGFFPIPLSAAEIARREAAVSAAPAHATKEAARSDAVQPV